MCRDQMRIDIIKIGVFPYRSMVIKYEIPILGYQSFLAGLLNGKIGFANRINYRTIVLYKT